MNNFTAIDFETAHGKRWSICQVGLVRIENEIFTDSLSILVQPPNNFYWDRFIDIHCISLEQTANSLTFDKVWEQVEPFITNQKVVAHNGFSFDFQGLNQTLDYYNIETPDYEKYCTYKIYKDNLASLCKVHSINLIHHDALSDAMACGELFGLYLKKLKINK